MDDWLLHIILMFFKNSSLTWLIYSWSKFCLPEVLKKL